MDKPKIRRTGGIVRASYEGVDDNGKPDGTAWIDDEVTDEPLNCDGCGKLCRAGVTCLDGGEFFHFRCVTIVERAS